MLIFDTELIRTKIRLMQDFLCDLSIYVSMDLHEANGKCDSVERLSHFEFIALISNDR